MEEQKELKNSNVMLTQKLVLLRFIVYCLKNRERRRPEENLSKKRNAMKQTQKRSNYRVWNCGICRPYPREKSDKNRKQRQKQRKREREGKKRFGPYDKMRKESVSEETNGKHVEVGFTPVIWAARQGGWEVNINICEG